MLEATNPQIQAMQTLPFADMCGSTKKMVVTCCNVGDPRKEGTSPTKNEALTCWSSKIVMTSV
jgi:hypothetical protein